MVKRLSKEVNKFNQIIQMITLPRFIEKVAWHQERILTAIITYLFFKI
jgi:hypothetical protein